MIDLHQSESGAIDCLISIGCGNPRTQLRRQQSEDILQNEQDGRSSPKPQQGRGRRRSQSRQEELAAFDSDTMHRNTYCWMKDLKGAYFRLDPFSDLWDLPKVPFEIDSGNEFGRDSLLEKEVRKCLESSPMQTKLSECAERLVDRRLAKVASTNVI